MKGKCQGNYGAALVKSNVKFSSSDVTFSSHTLHSGHVRKSPSQAERFVLFCFVFSLSWHKIRRRIPRSDSIKQMCLSIAIANNTL